MKIAQEKRRHIRIKLKEKTKKGIRRMPRRIMAKKGAESCEKP